MTNLPPPLAHRALKNLAWRLRTTQAFMGAERAVRVFWPLWSILCVGLAALAFGFGTIVSQPVFLAGLIMWGLAILAAVALGLRHFQMPTRAEAMARLDRTMPGRPIASLLDRPAIGANDPAAQSVWDAHTARMAIRVAKAQVPAPDLRLSARDHYAVRYLSTTALVMALLFGDFGQIGDAGDAVVLGTGPAAASGPLWEGWIEPPFYTNMPSLYLNDIVAADFETPMGAQVTVRTYAEPGAIRFSTDMGAIVTEEEANPSIHTATLEHSGTLTIAGTGGRTWAVSVLPDTPPAVTLVGDIETQSPGQMQLTFNATDDYGVASGRVSIAVDLGAVDRRFGLAIAPEPRADLTLDLPLPFRGTRTDFTEVLIENLTQHPFANLPVQVTLRVVDDAGQIGTFHHMAPRLPGRRFFDPLASALIEMRRDILWNRENAPRAAQILRALTHHPENGLEESVYVLIRTAIRRLESARDDILAENVRDEVADMLWTAALELEDGDLNDARARLERAQERLNEAIRQGASDDEIAALTQELRDAMDDYIQQLAENAAPSTDEPGREGDAMDMTMNDLDEMVRRIEELMQQGRMAEAQQMMQALQEMLENLEVVQGGQGNGDGPRTPGEQAMEDLQDTLRGQQDLSDDAFRDLQDQFNSDDPQQSDQPGMSGQQGQQPQGGTGTDQAGGDQPTNQGQAQPGQDTQQPGTGEGNDGGLSLAERQEALRRQLEEQTRRLPGAGTDAGDEALRRLDEAGNAMRDAETALERGDIAEALENQSQALEALREGMVDLNRALAQDRGEDTANQDRADSILSPDLLAQDPLGRQAGNSGTFGSDADIEAREHAFRRSQELLNELRRRAADQDRPQIERDYLRRLLDRF